MDRFKQEYIDLKELIESFRSSWLALKFRLLIKKCKRYWYLPLGFFLLVFSISYLKEKQQKESYQSYLIVFSQYYDKFELKELVEYASQLSKAEFEEELSLKGQDYQNISAIKNVGVVYRYDWLKLTSLNKEDSLLRYSWFKPKSIVILGITTNTSGLIGLSESLENLLENSKPVIQRKRERSKKLNRLQAEGYTGIQKLFENMTDSNRSSFDEVYWRLKHQILDAKYKATEIDNLSFMKITKPEKGGGFHLINCFINGFISLLLGLILLCFKKD